MPSAITIRQVEGKPGKVYYPLEKITIPEPKPQDNEVSTPTSARVPSDQPLSRPSSPSPQPP